LSKRKFRPLHADVVVQRPGSEKKKPSGLLLPFNKEIHSHGTILLVGEETESLKVGDYVLFDDAHTRKINLPEIDNPWEIGTIAIIAEKDVLAIVIK